MRDLLCAFVFLFGLWALTSPALVGQWAQKIVTAYHSPLPEESSK